MYSDSSKQLKAEFLLLVVAINWGLTFPFTKIMLEDVSPVLSVFIRFFITTLLFIIFYPKVLRSFNKDDYTKGLILGIFLFGGFITQTIGMKYTSASKAGFITGTYILMVPVFQYFISKRLPLTENIAGVIVASVGLYLLSNTGVSEFNIGDLLVLVCALFFALHIIYLDRYSRIETVNINNLIFTQFLTMLIFSLPMIWLFDAKTDNGIFLNVSFPLVSTVMFNSVIATLIGFVLINRYQRFTLPVKAALIYSLEQVFAALFAYLILSEVLTLIQVIGCGLMLFGLAISEFYRPIFKSKVL